MSRKKRYIKNLTKEEQDSLEKGYKTGKSFLERRKCQAILLSNAGQSVQELSSLYNVTTRGIYKWFNTWESEGANGLRLQPGRGRKAILDADDENQVKVIKELVTNDSQNLKNAISQIESKLGITMSKKTLREFLKKNLTTHGSDFENV